MRATTRLHTENEKTPTQQHYCSRPHADLIRTKDNNLLGYYWWFLVHVLVWKLERLTVWKFQRLNSLKVCKFESMKVCKLDRLNIWNIWKCEKLKVWKHERLIIWKFESSSAWERESSKVRKHWQFERVKVGQVLTLVVQRRLWVRELCAFPGDGRCCPRYWERDQ